MNLDYKIHSDEGVEHIEFESFEDLMNCWGKGCIPDFVTGTLTTLDGSHVIIPIDENAHTSMLEYYRENGVPVQYDSVIHEQALGVKRDTLLELSKQLIDASRTDAVPTPLGMMRAIRRNSKTYETAKSILEPNLRILEKINQPLGSFYREDTIVFDDENSQLLFVFDVSSSCDLDEIKKRDVIKGEVVTLWDADNLNLGEYSNEARIFGDDESIQKIKEKISEYGLIELYDIAIDGFGNSPSFPISDFGPVLSHGATDLYSTQEEKEFSITRVTKGMSFAAGSKGSSFFATIDDEVVEIKEGDYIGLNVGNQKHYVLSPEEVASMKKININTEMAMPF